MLTLTCGTHGNIIRLLPPLVIGPDLLADGLRVLRQAILAVAAESTSPLHPIPHHLRKAPL